jgi:hypothetical protein
VIIYLFIKFQINLLYNFILHFASMVYFYIVFMLCDNLINYNLLFNLMLQVIYESTYWTFHIREYILSNWKICFIKQENLFYQTFF